MSVTAPSTICWPTRQRLSRHSIVGCSALGVSHCPTFTGSGEPRLERWSLRFEPRRRTEEDVAEELWQRLMESVRLHMVSDAPVGAF